MEWEEQPEPLPDDLRQVLHRFQQGVLTLDARSIMESLPLWEGVKTKAEQNNYRADATSKLDRCLRSVQQKVLGLHRAYPALHTGLDGELVVLGQQFWGLLLELEHFILSQRKSNSIPGSIPKSEPQLFSNDDIKLSQDQLKINKLNWRSGKGEPVSPVPNKVFSSRKFSPTAGVSCSPTSHLLFPTGKGFKYRGKGFNAQSPWRWTSGGRGRGKGGKGKGKGTALCPSAARASQGTHSGPNVSAGTHSGPPGNSALHPFFQSASVSNCCSGVWVGGHPSSPQASKKFKLVVQKCLPPGRKHHQGRNKTSVASAPKIVRSGSSGPKSGSSRKNSAGLRKKWGSEKSGSLRNLPFTPLVPSVETRGGGGDKMAFYFRLPGKKYTLRGQKISPRPHARNFPRSKKGALGSKNRPEGRIFSRPGKSCPPAVFTASGRGPALGISSGPFWPKYHAPNFPKRNAHLRKKVEKKRVPGFHLPGRHTTFGTHPNIVGKTLGDYGAGPASIRVQNKHKKVSAGACPKSKPLGVRNKPRRGEVAVGPSENKRYSQRTWKVFGQTRNVKTTNVSNFGTNTCKSSGTPIFESFHQLVGKFFARKIPRAVGLKTSYLPRCKNAVAGNSKSAAKLVRKTLPSKGHPGLAFRQQHVGLGGDRRKFGRKNSGILEGEKGTPYKCKGNGGRHKYGAVIGKSGRNRGALCRQPSNLLLLTKRRGSKKSLQQNVTAIFQVADQPKCHVAGDLGALGTVQGRWIKSVGARSGGLFLGPRHVSTNQKVFQQIYSYRNRHVCIPREQKVGKVLQQVAPLAGRCGGRPPVSTGQFGGLVRKPPLVHNQQISPPLETISTHPCFDGRPLLGFSHVVAPINKNESSRDTVCQNSALQGFVHQLLGGKNASPPVVPLLPDLLRQILEGKQIQSSTIDDFLRKNPSIKRYQSSFSLLWRVLVKNGVTPAEASTDQIADAIIQIFKVSPAQARNAYSGVLLLPGIGGGLRFHPLLQPYKKIWNASTEKYGAFWDPTPLLLHLATTSSLSVLQQNLQNLRTQLIVVCRLLCLYRSSDLANLKRTASVMGGSLT